jgi:hypothetical protein
MLLFSTNLNFSSVYIFERNLIVWLENWIIFWRSVYTYQTLPYLCRIVLAFSISVTKHRCIWRCSRAWFWNKKMKLHRPSLFSSLSSKIGPTASWPLPVCWINTVHYSTVQYSTVQY